MKKEVLLFVPLLFLLTGCYMYSSDPVFGDCDTFLAYYDGCSVFLDSYSESVCYLEYEDYPDIPSSDEQCYPKVECSAFFENPSTAEWIRRCRYQFIEPKCVLSFDLSCEGWSASDSLLSLRIKNNMEDHVKDISLQVVSSDGTYDCKDSDNDRILAAGEVDTFYCSMPVGSYFEGILSMVYLDYRSGAMSTKEGSIVVVR